MSAARLDVLDGWRGLSILFVLAAHLLPLGPKAWELNASSGLVGMALFFTLSGFLITGHFLRNGSVGVFLVRRFFRIVPLAWVGILFALIFWGLPVAALPAHMLFYANWPPVMLVDVTGHYWSLCIEVQFYIGIALMFLVLRAGYFWGLLLLCFVVTGFRIYHGVYYAINTYFRVDEILAGSMLAFVYFDRGRWAVDIRKMLQSVPWPVLAVAFLLSTHAVGEWLNYLRPYIAAALVGSTLVQPACRVNEFLVNKRLAYVAAISFALYVIHPFLVDSWLGEGERLERYLKRLPLFLILWGLAHLSTFYFEKRFMNIGKMLSTRLDRK